MNSIVMKWGIGFLFLGILLMAGCIDSPDNSDPDTDGDGILDSIDDFPEDPNEWIDSDNDGFGDNSDIFPNNANEWNDTDSDGFGDNSDEFINDSLEWKDTDGDGVGDNSDAFPYDSDESIDNDSDGYGDNSDMFPQNKTEWKDSDGDGYGDNFADKFPNDPNEWFDSDSDGIGDNSDLFPENEDEWEDKDGDGHGDNYDDEFPMNSNEWNDTDSDGVGDNSDPFPNDGSEWKDSDGDGYGDNYADEFPNDPNEWFDSDSDGIGNNKDDYPDDGLYSAMLTAIDSVLYHYDGKAIIVGIIKNNKTENVLLYEMIATTYKSGNSYFKDNNDFFGFNTIILKPNEEYPFRIEIDDSSEMIASYNLDVRADYSNKYQLNSIYYKITYSGIIPLFGYNVDGEVSNNEPLAVINVYVKIALFDDSGSILDVVIGQSDPFHLGSGEEGSFSVTSKISNAVEIATFDVYISYALDE